MDIGRLTIFDRSPAIFSDRSWRRAYVTPVFKAKGSRTHPANYRPISITAVASRLLERILADRILRHCETNRLLDPRQFGFRAKRSTEILLVSTVDDWLTNFNNSRARTDVIFLDLKAAFDVVNHRFLVEKLRSFGISDELRSWIASFLQDRVFCVRVGDANSGWRGAASGVPQGSCIGPLLFLLYTSDLRCAIAEGVSHASFADDTQLYADVALESRRDALQISLDNIERWTKTWKFTLSPSKSATAHILHHEPHAYRIFDEHIPEVASVRVLGYLLSEDLRPETHLRDVLARAGRTADFIIRAFECRIPDVYIKAYRALVIPLLLYASPV